MGKLYQLATDTMNRKIRNYQKYQRKNTSKKEISGTGQLINKPAIRNLNELRVNT